MISDSSHYSNYRLTARLELKNKPGTFNRVVQLLSRQKANLGAIDIVEATREKITRDITFDVLNEAHGKHVLEKLGEIRDVKLVHASDRIFLLHLGGKISVQSKIPIKNRNQLSQAYTPGVARVSKAIGENKSSVYNLTIKGNSVAVVSDGSAILGLGNLGPEAALPVMEGKAMIFKEFAGIDAFPICLATQDTEEIIKAVQAISPVFGGINLEDISYPRCFEIENRLRQTLDIPVMHDDQHGTAVVVLAALKNALRIVKKDISKIRIVMSGIGAAGVACAKILLLAGARHIVACSRRGVVFSTEENGVHAAKRDFMSQIHRDNPGASLKETLKGTDVFIGVSSANLLTAKDLKKMKKDRIVFAMANPDPEVSPSEAVKVCRIFATGRSDIPNQINNALAFPGIFRGALDVRATTINEAMKLAAANAISGLISSSELSEEYIIPSIFDKRVVSAVSEAVARAAMKTGVARRRPKKESKTTAVST